MSDWLKNYFSTDREPWSTEHQTREGKFWQYWVGSEDGRPAMWTSVLFSIGGYRATLHKMVRADDPGCFHTHPAFAIRVVLWGGYVEEICKTYPGEGSFNYHKFRYPGYVGLVRPELEHRIAHLLNHKSSYSLWLRGPIVQNFNVRGC